MLVAVPGLKRITSRQNPLVARFRDAARREGDRILLDGVHLIGDALGAGLTIDTAVITAEFVDNAELRALATRLQRAGVDLVSASAPVIAALSPVRSSSAIVALAHAPDTTPQRLYARAPLPVLIACDVQDPGNVGAIVRVAEAAGAAGVVTAGRSADPFGWKALRGSMGSALRLPLLRRESADQAVDEARRHACRIVATVPRGGRSIFDARLSGATAVLVGGEGAGLPAHLVDAADERVTIPMQAPVESLNAAVTAALLLYEARRPSTGP